VRILLTGASSFTGAHLAATLHDAGHTVVAPLRRDVSAYEGVRAARVLGLAERAELHTGSTFGDERFRRLVEQEGPFDLFCHHAAQVEGYKDPGFDALGAAAANTYNLRQVLELLAAGGCRGVVLTGSVFEGGAGEGSDGLPAFSPYGVSKTLTAELVRYEARRAGLGLGRFVIANPFGPFEEPRFTSYLARTWAAGQTARVGTPAYVRDNLHVRLLAAAYADFAVRVPAAGEVVLTPSQYRETQGAFAERVARELRPRTGWECRLEHADQTEFPEPRERLGIDRIDGETLGISEAACWDELAAWYRRAFAAASAAA
jgi:nucleoside-diphosphate-sugar epimerase